MSKSHSIIDKNVEIVRLDVVIDVRTSVISLVHMNFNNYLSFCLIYKKNDNFLIIH